ncbi:c-type cytochrome [Fulvivirga sp. M361]|uniref:cytochrome c3 family protein n=1 Tax=Fulvivirga sp. M361 TaxID=2594266 RepID=UPI00117BA2E8|nr:cytochrome c3 family protein [Fulvivirga sp. M361]TRX61725.1 c-type cytochrome [Fulvivirga sp. M361]
MTPKISLTRVLFFVFFTSILSFPFISSAQDEIPTEEARISEGESLFKGNCASCHKVHEKLVGPALKDVYDRAPSIDWIVNFVWNSQKVIASGDEYANALWDEYKPTQMTAFPTFSRDQILSILAYVKVETEAGPAVAQVATDATTGAVSAGDAIPSFYLNTIMIGLVVVLVLILVVLILITTVLRKYLNQKGDLEADDAEIINSTFSLEGLVRSKPFIFLVTFIFAAVVFKVTINQLFAVGVQIGYAPKQPIAFSHEIHAGQYEIDCQYCHTGVRKSKSANIPSPNICMNCHSAIKTESPEIQKIYAAIENDKPIEWIRVHNLPDLAYFNHSQHVEVGNIECQTCHGPVEEMEVIGQHSLLTMGWCIDCHRNTEVNTKDNAYYDNLVELHDASSKEALKVEDIGGLECSKCHY